MQTQLSFHTAQSTQYVPQAIPISSEGPALPVTPTVLGEMPQFIPGYGYQVAPMPAGTMMSVPGYNTLLSPSPYPCALPTDLSHAPPAVNCQLPVAVQQGGSFCGVTSPEGICYQYTSPVDMPSPLPPISCVPLNQPPPCGTPFGFYTLANGSLVQCISPQQQFLPMTPQAPPGFTNLPVAMRQSVGPPVMNIYPPLSHMPPPPMPSTPANIPFRNNQVAPAPCTGMFCDGSYASPFGRGIRETNPMTPQNRPPYKNYSNGVTNPRYRVKTCVNFVSTGFCKYGDQCTYIHPKMVFNERYAEASSKARRNFSMPMDSRRALSAPSGAIQMRLYSSTPVSRRTIREGGDDQFAGRRNYRANFGFGTGCTKPSVIDGQHPKENSAIDHDASEKISSTNKAKDEEPVSSTDVEMKEVE